MSFSLGITKFVNKAKGITDRVVRKVVIDLGTKVIQRNPIGNPDSWQPQSLPPPKGYVGGRSRANWQYGFNVMPSGIIESTDGIRAIGTITANVSASPTGGIHWIANSLPYISRLEDGWSRQAPVGMVKLAVAEFGAVVNGAARSVNP